MDHPDDKKPTPRVALVCSAGGHLAEILALGSAYRDLPHFFVLNYVDPFFRPPDDVAVYTVGREARTVREVGNLVEYARIFRKERPTALLSTGASQGVYAAVVARAMGVRVVYVETLTAVQQPSLTGVLMQGLADDFFVQWPGLVPRVEEARWVGNLFGSSW
jgi:beta-1,4-N-acetylglucosaminyltransferase